MSIEQGEVQEGRTNSPKKTPEKKKEKNIGRLSVFLTTPFRLSYLLLLPSLILVALLFSSFLF